MQLLLQNALVQIRENILKLINDLLNEEAYLRPLEHFSKNIKTISKLL